MQYMKVKKKSFKTCFVYQQVIHNLSMWSANDKSMSFDQVKKDAGSAKKDMKLVRDKLYVIKWSGKKTRTSA